MNKKFKLVLSVAVVLIAIGGYVFPKVQVAKLSGASGFDFLNPFVNFNGIVKEYRSSRLGPATSTPCSLLSPSATSTLIRTGLQVMVATSTATTWYLATSTTAYATTSLLTLPYSLGSSSQGTMEFDGTTTAVTAGIINSPDIIPPSTYIVWAEKGVVIPTSDKLLGKCSAEFIVN